MGDLTVAIFSLCGTVLGAIVAALLQVVFLPEGRNTRWAVFGLIMVLGAIAGLILGAIIAVWIFSIRDEMSESVSNPTENISTVVSSVPQPTPTQLLPGENENIVVTTSFEPTATIPLSDLSESDFCPPVGSSDAIHAGDLTLFGDPIASVGTGIFLTVVRPPGKLPTKYTYLSEALTDLCVQTISPGNLFDRSGDRHCSISNFTTNRLWVGTVLAQTTLYVKKTNTTEFIEIGRIDVPVPDSRSYIVEYNLTVNDEICLVAPVGTTMGDLLDRGGYHVFWGRDLQAISDSWCMLLENDNTQHYCN